MIFKYLLFVCFFSKAAIRQTTATLRHLFWIFLQMLLVDVLKKHVFLCHKTFEPFLKVFTGFLEILFLLFCITTLALVFIFKFLTFLRFFLLDWLLISFLFGLLFICLLLICGCLLLLLFFARFLVFPIFVRHAFAGQFLCLSFSEFELLTEYFYCLTPYSFQ